MPLKCATCGRPFPDDEAPPTERELDLLMAWWDTRNVRKAAEKIGMSYQRAKNVMARCRLRSGASSNEALLLVHMDRLHSRMLSATQQNNDRSAA